MEEPKRLLVIDDDFHAYDTPRALNLAIDDLRQQGQRWAFYVNLQARAKEAIEKGQYHGLIIDNDFGDGMVTLAGLVDGVGLGIPIGYVTAYDIEGLDMQNRHTLQRKSLPYIDPVHFQRLGVTHIRKRGNNVYPELSVEDLRKSLFDFLMSIKS